eukprot:scaffold231573_cov31-Tisochrysis_lutea.AAC.2
MTARRVTQGLGHAHVHVIVPAIVGSDYRRSPPFVSCCHVFSQRATSISVFVAPMGHILSSPALFSSYFVLRALICKSCLLS